LNVPCCHTEDGGVPECKGGLMHGDSKIPDPNAGDPSRPAPQSPGNEASGTNDLADAVQAWQRLRQTGGRRVTLIDLYRLAAASQGLAADHLPREQRQRLAQIALSSTWPGFSITNGSDRPPDPIEVVDYDPAWPGLYEKWRNRLTSALRTAALRIEHVGSTAVPGLAAKPVIDIQVSVADLGDESSYVPQIETTGMQLRSRDQLHRYFRPGAGRPRQAQVHVCGLGSTWEYDHLLFRDYLRTHSAARDAYAEAKRDAARIWRDDRLAYPEAKTGIILDMLEAGEQWAQSINRGPRPQ
jgi:GrpB-like predicted nucleotidyltransferase (UPF0157 family)